MSDLMKHIFITAMSLFIGLGAAFANSSQKTKPKYKAGAVVKALDLQVFNDMPRRLAHLPLEKLLIKKNVIAFQVHGVQLVFELLDAKKGIVGFNGQVFYAHEISDVTSARKSIHRKLVANQRPSLSQIFLNIVLPEAWAESKRESKSFNFLTSLGLSAPSFSSLSGLSEFLDENRAEEAMDIAANLLSAISGFGKRNSAFKKIFSFGSSGDLPEAPNFSTSSRSLQ